jgi:hypothetical protein
VVYLSRHKHFVLAGEVDQISERIAFLLYLLTYENIPNQVNGLGSKSFCTDVSRRSQRTIQLLNAPSDLEKRFHVWGKSSKRFHKRLWAALRDYLKKGGSDFYEYFESALNESNSEILAQRIALNQDTVLVGLEVPGDVWNLQFFKRVLGEDIQPRQLRRWFDALRKDGRLPKNAAVERFDVTFRYSPRMCDERRERCCIFRKDSDIWDHYCPPRRGIDWRGSRCPVTDHLCGIEYACEPNGCPVREGAPTDLCRGCRISIRGIE